MGVFIQGLLAVVFLTPTAAVKWSPERASLHFYLESQDQHTSECLDKGLEVRYRLEYHLCRRRGSWLDDCSDKKLTVRTVHYNPVSESVEIITDTLSDSEVATSIIEPNLESAASTINSFTLDGLTQEQLATAQKQTPHGQYVSVRIRGFCEQNENSLINQIPYYLTFGIFRFTGFDTGWIDYEIQ